MIAIITMDELIKSLVTSSPSIIGGIVVLVLMLKHINARESAIEKVTQHFSDAMKMQAERCHVVQEDSTMVMRETVKAITELKVTVQSSDLTMREVRGMLSRHQLVDAEKSTA